MWIKELQARKEHECDTCRASIKTGEVYCSHRWAGESTVCGIAICDACQKLHSFVNGGRLWVSHDHIRGLSDFYGPVDWLRQAVVAQLRVVEHVDDRTASDWMVKLMDAEIRMAKSELSRLGQLLVDDDDGISVTAVARRISKTSEYICARRLKRGLLLGIIGSPEDRVTIDEVENLGSF